MEQKRFIIIDSDALLYRAYYALPPLKNNKGEVVNAVYGFLLVFLKTIREFNPNFIVAAFDFPSPTFRHKKYKKYKSKRLRAPDDLRQQFPKIKEILKNFRVQMFEKKGFEADDIIGTIVKEKEKKYPEVEAIILSGDMDIFRLASKNTKIYFLKQGVKNSSIYDEKKVKDRYQGLEPKQLPDIKGLRGDPSDNIPGVFGIGEKTAICLVKKFGTIENLYEKLEKDDQETKEIKKTVKKKLLEQKEQAFTSKMLSEIRFDVPIEFDLNKCRWGEYNKEKIIQIFKEYQFKTLLNRLP